MTRPGRLSTQRNAGMSSFDPSRIPAWLAPVCDERSGSHSTSRWVDDWSHDAMVVAFPSRIARRSTGSASPSISRKMIPGMSVFVTSPCRRAMRCTTLSVYVSSSFVPARTSRTTLTAEATTAATSAHHAFVTLIALGATFEATTSIAASASRISTNPSSAISGSRSAAISGGMTAFRIAIRSAATTAPRNPSTDTPGTISAATKSAAAERSHESSTRAGLYVGFAGFQATLSPNGGLPAVTAGEANKACGTAS